MSALDTLKLKRIDYSDLYFGKFRSENNYNKEDFLISLLSFLPIWIKRKIGNDERTLSSAGNSTFTIGNKYLCFDVIEVNDIEIIIGGNEHSMDYRFSVAFINNIDDTYIAVISTKVYLKSIFGKLIFFFIKPLHKKITKKIFDETIKSLGSE